jgi:hypothetical protein
LSLYEKADAYVREHPEFRSLPRYGTHQGAWMSVEDMGRPADRSSYEENCMIITAYADLFRAGFKIGDLKRANVVITEKAGLVWGSVVDLDQLQDVAGFSPEGAVTDVALYEEEVEGLIEKLLRSSFVPHGREVHFTYGQLRKSLQAYISEERLLSLFQKVGKRSHHFNPHSILFDSAFLTTDPLKIAADSVRPEVRKVATSDGRQSDRSEMRGVVLNRPVLAIPNRSSYSSHRANVAQRSKRMIMKRAAKEKLEKFGMSAGILLNVKELELLRPEETEAHWKEVFKLLAMNKKYDLYLDDPENKYQSVSAIKIPELQKMLAQCPDRIHLGRGGGSALQNKQILIQASFSDNVTAEQTATMKADIQERYKLSQKTVHALDYRRAGALRAFLGIAELLKNNPALLHAIGDYAVLGSDGRWQIAEAYLTLALTELRAGYVVQWSA